MSNDSELNSSLRKIAKGAGINFIGLALASLLGFGSRMVLARSLGPAEYGLIALGIALFSITANIGTFGLPGGVIRFVSFYRGKGDLKRVKGVIISALRINLPVGLFLAAVLFLGAEWISVSVFNEPDFTPVLRVFAIAPPFLVLARNLLSATVGFEDMRYKVYVNEIFQNSFRFIAIAILIALGFGVLGGAVGWILAIIIMPFIAFYFLEKKVFPIVNTNIKASHMDRELFSFSWPLMFTRITTLIVAWTDTLMLGFFTITQDVGIYNVALPTTRLMRMGLTSLASISMPVITGLYSQGKFEEIRASYSTVTKWVLAVSLPLFVVMLLFSESIIRVLFGQEYIEGATAMSILAFGFFLFSLTGLSQRVLTAFGRPKLNMISSSTAAGGNVILNATLIPIYGINGAAIATATSFALMGGLNLVFVYRIGKMQPFKLSYIKIMIAAVIAVLTIYGITKLFFAPAPIYVLVPMFLIFLALYFFLLLVLKSFEKEDLMIMRAIDQKLGLETEWIRKIIRKFL